MVLTFIFVAMCFIVVSVNAWVIGDELVHGKIIAQVVQAVASVWLSLGEGLGSLSFLMALPPVTTCLMRDLEPTANEYHQDQ